MRPIGVDFPANGTYRADHILIGHRGTNVGEGKTGEDEGCGSADAREVDRLCQSVDRRPGSRRAARAVKAMNFHMSE